MVIVTEEMGSMKKELTTRQAGSRKMQNNDLKVDGGHDILKATRAPEETVRQILGLIYSLGIAQRVFEKLEKRQQR